MKPVYKRVLLKISGQSLAGERGFGIDSKTIQTTAREIVELAGVSPRGRSIFSPSTNTGTVRSSWSWWGL